MRLKLQDRDYVPDGTGGFLRTTESDRLAEQAAFLLAARRGAFSAFPELGSRLYLLGKEIPSERETMALHYAQEALAPIGLTVTEATVTESPEGLRVSVQLGETDTALEVITT